MNVHALAADIASRVPALAEDCVTNRADVIAGLITEASRNKTGLRQAILNLSTVRTPNKDGFLWSQRDEFIVSLERIVSRRVSTPQMQFELLTASNDELREALELALKNHEA